MADLPLIQPEGVVAQSDMQRTAGAGSLATAQAYGHFADVAGQFQDLAAAHLHTVDAAQIANLRSSVDGDIHLLRAQHMTDPDGFKQAYADYRANLVKATPGRYAPAVTSYADRTAGAQQGDITIESARENHKNAIQDLTARGTMLTSRIGDTLASGGGMAALKSDPQLQSDQQEFSDNLAALVRSGAMGQAEADLKLQQAQATWKAGAVTGHIMNTYRTSGAQAALKELSAIETGTDDSLAPHERALAATKARSALEQALNVDNQAANLQRSTTEQQRQDNERDIANDAASYELHGQGSGLTEDQVMARGGLAAVAKWHKDIADGLEKFRLYGDLSRLSPDEAAARIASVAATKGDKLPTEIKNEKDFGSLSDAIALVETHGNSAQVSPKGALGKYQITPDAAATVLGHPLSGDEKNRLLHDDEFNGQIHRQILAKNLTDNQGDPFKAVMAYHAGQGNVDKWVKQFGDPAQVGYEAWLQNVHDAGNPESAAYPKLVAAAMKNGQAWQAWDAAQTQRRDDPAGAVASDPVVAASIADWQSRQAGKVPGQGAGESGGFRVVQSVLDAQKRAGIKPKNMQPLPNAAIDAYVNSYKDIAAQSAAAKDPTLLLKWRDRVVQEFMDPTHPNSEGYGRRVLQAVYSRAGASDLAAGVSSSLVTRSAVGAPITRTDPALAANAARVDAVHRAASGTQAAPVVPAEAVAELRANRGNPVYIDSFRRHFGDPARYLGGN